MEIIGGNLVRNETNVNAVGGTEMMATRLYSALKESEVNLDKFQIICSRVRELDENKIRILWCHDLAGDPESEILRNGGWRQFHKLVFVSHWQRDEYIREYGIPYSHCTVIYNGIEPITDIFKPTDKVNLIYHTTPHRGLDIATRVVERLAEKHGDKIHFDVFSSFRIYGWQERDEPYQQLFDDIKNHPQMTYHGFVPNDQVRQALGNAHIYAFPSTWPETFGISLAEAMSAKCMVVHPNLAALPEIASKWTYMYDYHEDKSAHAGAFHYFLDTAIETILNSPDRMEAHLTSQKAYTDLFYSFPNRIIHSWTGLLVMLENSVKDTSIVKGTDVFVYET